MDGGVEVVGGREREIDQGLVLARETKNHARRAQFRSGIEISGGDGGGDLWNGVDKGVEVVGEWEREIDWGWGFWPAKSKTVRAALGFGLVWKSGVGRPVGTCQMLWMGELRWWEAGSKRLIRGGGFGPPNEKLCAPCSVLVWY